MKLTITTLVIIEGSYIQGIFHSLEEHPGKAYQELVDLFENLRENLILMDLTQGADDQYYDYSPSQVEAILFGILQLTKEHQDIIVTELKRQLKSFIQDKVITRYTCIYNAIEKWELTHMDTKILHQLEVFNLLKHLSNN